MDTVRIVVADDNLQLRNMITEYLGQQSGMEVVGAATNGLETLELVQEKLPDVLICDMIMPKMDGYEVLSQLRKEGQDLPVLILSAKNDLEDKIQGFVAGADDYVTKPFEIRELLMRIQAICRRRGTQEIASLQLGSLALNSTSCEINNLQSGKFMKIAGKELQLMEFFLRNPNQVLEKEQIATKVWGYESDAEYNNVEVYVSFLRRKLKYLHVDVRIRTVRGVGYILEEGDD